jgi:hypothetical protein
MHSAYHLRVGAEVLVMEIAGLVLAALGVVAAIIAALPPLGVDVRIFGRPNMPLEGIPHFRARQARIAIVVALISLGVSVGAFYYFFRPRVVEKIVEKPIDRIVEKTVEKPAIVPCPKQKTAPAKAIGTPIIPVTINSSPGGFATSGGTLLNPTVNNFAPLSRVLTDQQAVDLGKIANNLGARSITILNTNTPEAENYGTAIYNAIAQTAKRTLKDDGAETAIAGLTGGKDAPTGTVVCVNSFNSPTAS